MSIGDELGFRKPVVVQSHEALLNIYYTASCLKKKAAEFFRRYNLTDVQFNLMMLLAHQSGPEGGLSQARLSDMMLVNRANITSLIDRMEKADLVVRTAAPGDRRYNIIKLTEHGRKMLDEISPLYADEVKKAMAVLKENEQRKLIMMLEEVRTSL